MEGRETYYLEHVEESMRDAVPVFRENIDVRNAPITDPSGKVSRIIEEHKWYNLNVPLSSQEEEDVDCLEIALVDTIQMRQQINESRNLSSGYIGGVVGQKFSAKHLFHLNSSLNGYQEFRSLITVPVTTKLEFDEKTTTNIIKGQPYGDMLGCSAHKIQSLKAFVVDSADNTVLPRWCSDMRTELVRDGPLFGSLYNYNGNVTLLGYEGKLYNKLPGDSIPDESHAVTLIGWGRCADGNGSEELYWCCQNTWGHPYAQTGRLGNNVLDYAIAPVVENYVEL